MQVTVQHALLNYSTGLTALCAPLIYPANSIRSDGRPRRIRCYEEAANDLPFAQCKQLHRGQQVTYRPNVGAGGGCWKVQMGLPTSSPPLLYHLFVRIDRRKPVPYWTRLNKVLAISRMVTGLDYKEYWKGEGGAELTRLESEALQSTDVYFPCVSGFPT